MNAVHCVTIRKEEPDFFAGTKLELFTGDTETTQLTLATSVITVVARQLSFIAR